MLSATIEPDSCAQMICAPDGAMAVKAPEGVIDGAKIATMASDLPAGSNETSAEIRRTLVNAPEVIPVCEGGSLPMRDRSQRLAAAVGRPNTSIQPTSQ